MKKTQQKYISFFLFCFLLFSSFGQALAAEGEETTEEDSETYISQDDFIKSHQPEVRSEVTIKKDSDVKVIKEEKNYNLDKIKKSVVVSAPSWMLKKRGFIDCTKGNRSLFYRSSVQNSAGCKIEVLDVNTGEINKFSIQVLKDIIIQASQLEVASADEDSEIDENSDENLETEEEKDEDTEDSDENTEENSDDEEGGDFLESLGVDLGLSLDDEESEESDDEGDSSDGDSEVSDFDEKEDETSTSTTKKTSSILTITDKKIIVTTGTGSTEDVESVIEYLLDPDGFEVTKEEEENLEMAIEEGLTEEEIIESVKAHIDEVFPEVDVKEEIRIFSDKLFTSNITKILYSAGFETEEISLSSSDLALTTEKIQKQKEILTVGDYKILGLEGHDYYNVLIADLFEDMLQNIEGEGIKNQLAKDVSSVSFSLSTYTNGLLSSDIREEFRKKLVRDLRKLEKYYSQSLQSEADERERKKQEKIQNFFSARMSIEKEKREAEREKELERLALIEKEKALKELLLKKQESSSNEETDSDFSNQETSGESKESSEEDFDFIDALMQ